MTVLEFQTISNLKLTTLDLSNPFPSSLECGGLLDDSLVMPFGRHHSPLQRSLKHLEIDFTDLPQSAVNGFFHFIINPSLSLTTLELTNASLDSSHFDSIRRSCKSLTKLCLVKSVFPKLFPLPTTLTNLDLRHTPTSDQDLLDVVATLQSLTVLDLFSTQVTSLGLNAVRLLPLTGLAVKVPLPTDCKWQLSNLVFSCYTLPVGSFSVIKSGRIQLTTDNPDVLRAMAGHPVTRLILKPMSTHQNQAGMSKLCLSLFPLLEHITVHLPVRIYRKDIRRRFNLLSLSTTSSKLHSLHLVGASADILFRRAKKANLFRIPSLTMLYVEGCSAGVVPGWDRVWDHPQQDTTYWRSDV